MRSFFEGEIIDFKIHSLETENFSTDDRTASRGARDIGGRDRGEREGGGGRSEGLGVDARYWRGVGPFRELLEQERAKRKDGTGANKINNSSTTTTTTTRTRRHRRWEIGPEDRLDHDDHLHDDDDDNSTDEDNDDDDAAVEDSLGGEDILASHLRSRSWIENVLLRDWILMRWKERCFIPPSQSVQIGQNGAAAAGVEAVATVNRTRNTAAEGSGGDGGDGGDGGGGGGSGTSGDPSSFGLTISGFYYVALRRQTGEIDGLYFDPGSAPFQVLGLRPVGVNVGNGIGGGGGGGGKEGGGGGGSSSRGRMAVKGRFPAMQFR